MTIYHNPVTRKKRSNITFVAFATDGFTSSTSYTTLVQVLPGPQASVQVSVRKCCDMAMTHIKAKINKKKRKIKEH